MSLGLLGAYISSDSDSSSYDEESKNIVNPDNTIGNTTDVNNNNTNNINSIVEPTNNNSLLMSDEQLHPVLTNCLV